MRDQSQFGFGTRSRLRDRMLGLYSRASVNIAWSVPPDKVPDRPQKAVM